MDREKELTRHLRSELVKIRPKDKPIIKFSLRHASPGAKGNEVDTWEHDTSISLEDIPRMAADIVGRAQTDADGMGPGMHRYVVQTITKGEAGKGGRFMFRLSGGEDEGDEVGGEDSPTMKGIVSQLMRHNEALMRGMTQATGTMMGLMTRRMESQDTEMTQMRKDRQDTFLALEEAKSQQHERDMTAMEIMDSSKRKEMAFKKIMELAPVVVNRLSGKELVPQKASAMDMMLENLVNSLNQDQFQAIASQLTPEQTLTFVEILRTFQERQKKNAESETTS